MLRAALFDVGSTLRIVVKDQAFIHPAKLDEKPEKIGLGRVVDGAGIRHE